MKKINWQLKNSRFLFYLGSFESVANHILNRLGGSLIILPTSLNDLALSWGNKTLARSYGRVDICTTDGMPLVLGFGFYSKQRVSRVYGPDLMFYLLKKSTPKTNHYFLSANPKTEEKLSKHLAFNFSNLKETHHSFLEKNLDELKNEELILKKIKNKSPDVLWIGIGSPKQVELAVKWKRELSKTTIICVGAAFDLLIGNELAAPTLVKKIGLEWLFRLSLSPGRLWKRYLIRIPRFIFSYSFFKIKNFFESDNLE